MNKNVTSRQELIDAAMEISRTEGVHKVNIRNIAKKCSISVGVLYNYFPTKSDLIFAVVEGFWTDVLRTLTGMEPKTAGFTDFVASLYEIMNAHLNDFERDWLAQLETMDPEDKKRGRRLEEQCFQVLRNLLRDALDRDPSVSPDIWNADYTKEQFVEFVFHHLMSLLRSGADNCSFFTKTLQRILY